MNHILLNGLLYEGKGTGISVYTKELAKAFIKQKKDDVDILIRQTYKKEYQDYPNVQYANKEIYGSKDRILYEQIYGLKKYNSYDLIHFPDYALSIGAKAKKIITIHDMAMYTMAGAYTKKQVLVKRTLLKEALRQCSGILCDSEFSKNELIRYFPNIQEKCIKVVYLGVNTPEKIENVDKSLVMKKYGINKPYLICTGTLAPSKNIPNLLRAFEVIKQKHYDVQIVLAGKRGWMCEELDELLNHSRYRKDMIITGFVSEEELEVLYQNASVGVSASLYEGFGLTPLEMMIRNIPVAVSDLPIFKEICGDSVCYFQPYDLESMANTLINIIQDQKLQEYLKEKGLRCARRFNWGKTAEETYKFYKEVQLK